MNNYYMTFGQRYSYEAHPTLKGAHPDGVLQVIAPDEGQARDLVFEEIGQHWAFLYPEESLSWCFYPRGVTHVLDSEGLRVK